MTAQRPMEIVCDARGLAADAVSVEALARLALSARRAGAELRVTGAAGELSDLLAFCGLAEFFVARLDDHTRSPPDLRA
jgi:hypothetical protein